MFQDSEGQQNQARRVHKCNQMFGKPGRTFRHSVSDQNLFVDVNMNIDAHKLNIHREGPEGFRLVSSEGSYKLGF